MDIRHQKRVKLSPELNRLVDLSIKEQFKENVTFFTLSPEERKQIIMGRIWKQFFGTKKS